VRRGHFVADERLKRRLPRILFATAVMTVALWAFALATGMHALDGAPRALALVGAIALGMAVFAAAGQALGAVSLGEIRAMMRRRKAPVAPPPGDGGTAA